MSGKRYKTLIIAELLVLYFSLLIVISCWRGPIRYRFDPNDDLLAQTELTLLSDPDGMSSIQKEKVSVHNQSGGVFVVGAPIILSGTEVISVQFELDCPKAYAGKEIHVDLMGDDYDSDEQECIYHLLSGKQTFTCEISVGDYAPDKAMFRVFCLEPMEFEFSGLSLLSGRLMPKVQTGHWVALAVAAALLMTTLIIGIAMRGKTGEK